MENSRKRDQGIHISMMIHSHGYGREGTKRDLSVQDRILNSLSSVTQVMI